MEKIAIIGAGLIGCAWATVFSRAGYPVALYDLDPKALENAPAQIESTLQSLRTAGLISEDPAVVMPRIRFVPDLAQALQGAGLVQENVRETVEAKLEIFARLDALAPADAILASSTSGIPASSFTEHLAGRTRCLVGHPINPPSLVPLVELIPAPWTDPGVMERARALYAGAGQVPIMVRREIQGFIVNRLQGALLAEAFRLVEDGYVDSIDCDKAIKDGLGLRWAFMGPFETIDLNAPGGIRDYCQRYGPLYHDIARQAQPRAWESALLDQLERERLQALDGVDRPARQRWRDGRLMQLVAHKRQQTDKH
ncbi:3-hydroxyacyl-CoA dehydrogenase [Herbaspirillum sp. NPDC087042]|uniref:3-hydroxyacyl-CoA dehydrogenase n=1 Tax=Herbaspirillum sp. NPDC087042 TaxID=3364004 RepID=UPI003813BA85